MILVQSLPATIKLHQLCISLNKWIRSSADEIIAGLAGGQAAENRQGTPDNAPYYLYFSVFALK